MPNNVLRLRNLFKRDKSQGGQSVSLTVSKSYSWSTFILFLVLLVGTQGAAKSVIVDDDDTRIQYSSIGWDRNFDLNKGRVLDGTLHVGSASDSDVFFTFTFNGTSVELRHVRSTIPGLILNPTYLIDGNRVQATPSRDLDPSANGRQEPWAYNQTLVNVTGLVNAEHKLEVHLSQPDQLFFDYIVYEEVGEDNVVPSESTTSSVIDPPLHELSTKSSSTAFVSTRTLYSSSAVPTLGSAVNEPGKFNSGPLIGGVVSGVVVVVLIVVFYWFLKRRRNAWIHWKATPYEGETFSLGTTLPVQNTTRSPENHTSRALSKRVQGFASDDSVEAGWMSTQMSASIVGT